MIILRDNIGMILKMSNKEKEMKTKKLNNYFIAGGVCLLVFILNNQFDILSFIFRNQIDDLVAGALTSLGLLFEFIVFYNNNHDVTFKQRKKEFFLSKSFNYFPKDDVEYIFSECQYLSKLKRGLEVDNYPTDDSSYKTFSLFSSYIVLDILEKLMGYYERIKNIFSDKNLVGILRKTKSKFQKEVHNDFCKYNCSYNTEYARPQVNYETHVSISEKMCDSSVNILGPRGGITTMNRGEMVYIATAVAGVTLDRAIRANVNR